MCGHIRGEQEWIVIDRLADVILSCVKGCIVDIGVGLSTVILARYAKKFNRVQYSCDINQRVINKYIGNGLHDKHIIVNKSSLDFIDDFKQKVAIAFIDGWHKYDIVKQESEVMISNMVSGSIMFMHDTFPRTISLVSTDGNRCGDVYRIRQELEKDNRVDTFTWRYRTQADRCGLTMVMKKDTNMPFYKQ